MNKQPEREPATLRQLEYLAYLIKQHPNFRKHHRTNPSVVLWLNQKYGEYLTNNLSNLADLERYEASEIISRLEDKLRNGGQASRDTTK